MADATPSTASIAIATGIISLLFGYFLGQGASLGLFSSSHPLTPSPIPLPGFPSSSPSSSDSESDSTSSSSHQPLSSFPTQTHSEEHKLVLVVRTDLGMTKGKIAAQCSHATLACYRTLRGRASARGVLRQWERGGQAKIAVQVGSEEDLLELQARAMSVGLCARVVRDAGRTQIAAGSATVLGVGPGPKTVVDGITGGLKLL
jgi:peptidyl-tRNA hydrolase